MKNGEAVAQFEAAFAEYVGAEFAIAMCNGTATLHTALVALGVHADAHCDIYADGYQGDLSYDGKSQRGTPVAVPPLTMASTTIAVLHAGGVPVFADVDPDTWLASGPCAMGVSLYGLHGRTSSPYATEAMCETVPWWVDDAAQTLRPHDPAHKFTSYSFQASKILLLGEGGMLCTNDRILANIARSFSSLGYAMAPDGPFIDPHTLKHPTFARHHLLGCNYRMSDLVAADGVQCLAIGNRTGEPLVHWYKSRRREAAAMYREAVTGCPWITPQRIPEGWQHDYWAYAVALESAELWEPFTDAIVRHGGEMPYGAWRLTYQEPAFRHLAEDGCCPVAEDLQPRLVQFQTNDLTSARKNADAVSKAIREIDG